MVYTWEARQCGRPTTRIYVDMGGSLGRRPYRVYMGSPTEREAQRQKHVKIHGGPSKREAVLYTLGKPDNAGGPPPGST